MKRITQAIANEINAAVTSEHRRRKNIRYPYTVTNRLSFMRPKYTHTHTVKINLLLCVVCAPKHSINRIFWYLLHVFSSFYSFPLPFRLYLCFCLSLNSMKVQMFIGIINSIQLQIETIGNLKHDHSIETNVENTAHIQWFRIIRHHHRHCSLLLLLFPLPHVFFFFFRCLKINGRKYKFNTKSYQLTILKHSSNHDEWTFTQIAFFPSKN